MEAVARSVPRKRRKNVPDTVRYPLLTGGGYIKELDREGDSRSYGYDIDLDGIEEALHRRKKEKQGYTGHQEELKYLRKRLHDLEEILYYIERNADGSTLPESWPVWVAMKMMTLEKRQNVHDSAVSVVEDFGPALDKLADK